MSNDRKRPSFAIAGNDVSISIALGNAIGAFASAALSEAVRRDDAMGVSRDMSVEVNAESSDILHMIVSVGRLTVLDRFVYRLPGTNRIIASVLRPDCFGEKGKP